MSKKVLLFSVLFSFSYLVFGSWPSSPGFIPNRTLGGSKFHLGFFAGPNFSNLILDGKFFISDSYLATSEFTNLPHWGFAGIYQMNETWSLQLEINRESKGMAYSDVVFYTASGQQLNTQIDNQLRLDFYTIPVMFKYHMGRVILTYFEGGPYFSYLNQANEEGRMRIQGISPITGSIETKITDFEFARSREYTNEYGFALGWGIIVPLTRGIWGPTSSIFANIRYGQGFNNLYVGKEAESLNDVEVIIGFEPEAIDPRFEENKIRSQNLTIRFGFVISI